MKTRLFLVISALAAVSLLGCEVAIFPDTSRPSQIEARFLPNDLVGIENTSPYDQLITIEFSDGDLAHEPFELRSHEPCTITLYQGEYKLTAKAIDIKKGLKRKLLVPATGCKMFYGQCVKTVIKTAM